MERLEAVCEIKNVLFEHLYHKPRLDPKALFEELMGYRDQIAPHVGDAMLFVKEALAQGKEVLLEAQLGSMKDPRLRHLSLHHILPYPGRLRLHGGRGGPPGYPEHRGGHQGILQRRGGGRLCL